MRKITQFISKVYKKISNNFEVPKDKEELKECLDSFEKENRALRREIKCLKKENSFGYPKGHYYSPVHKLEDLVDYEKVSVRSKKNFYKFIPKFSDTKIKENYRDLTKYFKDFDYPIKEDNESRFYIENCSYPITDALILFSMIRKIKPKRIIEIGSGFTSALMMDVNERYFHNTIEMVFIEPYPELLLQRMRGKDEERYKVIATGVQSVPIKEFKKLESGDILFIDSTHVSKFNSDVNYELFDILPNLNPGVIVHFHDVFDGFEYPLQWLKNGWAWNEDYLLRAYLMGNKDYDVLLMNDYLVRRYPRMLLKSFKRVENNCGGGFWIKKTSSVIKEKSIKSYPL